MESDIRGNPAVSRFEMPLADGRGRVLKAIEHGRVDLRHTEMTQELSALGYGSQPALGIFEVLQRDGKKPIAKAPIHVLLRRTTPRVRCTPRCLSVDRAGRTRAWRFKATIPLAYRMHAQKEFPMPSAASDRGVHWVGRTPNRLNVG